MGQAQRSRGRLKSWVVLTAMACACWVAFPLGLWWVDRFALGVAPSAYTSLPHMVFNALPGLLLALFLVAISRRLLFPILLVSCLQGMVYIASKMKLAILGSPFALPDFYFLRDINKASIQLFGAYVENSGQLLFIGTGVVAVLVAAFWVERPSFARFGRVQWLLLAAASLAIVSLYAAAWPWGSMYSKDYVRPSPLNQIPAVLRSGLMTSMVYKHLQISNMRFDVDMAALADAAALARQAHGQSPAGAPDDGAVKPDIIVILSESFMDPQLLNGMASVPDSIPTVRRYMEARQGGAMVVPTYGGGTVRTEFEVLTGMPAAAFPDAYYPYVDLNPRVMPGLPGYLKKIGYRTLAIHGNSGSFWNRTNTYTAMGFDRFVTARQFREKGRVRDGTWYSDESMTDAILDELSADADSSSFIMAVSIQNHGPYVKTRENLDVRDPARWESIQLPEGLHGGAATELRNYLYSLQSADQQLARLLQALDQRNRPYVVAFFGDHLPALADAYAATGFVDDRRAEQQYTPWVLLSNNGKDLPAHQRTLQAWQLPSEILVAAELSGDAYFNLVGMIGRALESKSGGEDVQKRLRAGLAAAANSRIKGGTFEEYIGAK